ncbi:MAG: Rrf2 family transcriptional regulator [Gammaproteobacteria bacterium]|nr:MAG: Rrf2 family transcriptional regulator [Gammaproteobacteria bacterium]RLD32224.1 MAG: Rrf2 family transcriptional regulator [Bacteroidota bacterium]
MAKIINFSDAATIGIHGLIVLAKSKKPVNAIELSEKIKYSKHHIGKVMQRLVKIGLLSSFRGPTGGFQLKKKPEDILLYDIYTAIEGEVELGECPHDLPICPVDKCIRNEVITKLSEEFVNFLRSATLNEYL